MIQELINFSKIVIPIGRRSERKMKNTKRAALFVLILSMLLPGCGADNNSESTSDDAENENIETVQEEDVLTEDKEEEDSVEEYNSSPGEGAVYSGGNTTAIIDAQGNLLICGSNQSGQLGDTIPSQKSTYSLVASDIKSVCGSSSFAAISNSNILYTWGSNSYGQLGPNRELGVNTELVQVDSNVVDVAIGGGVCAYVTKSGELFVMGYPRVSFGDEADTKSSATPVKIMDNAANVELSTNNDYGTTFAALTVDNELYMWGDNSEGMVDPDTVGNVDKPMEIMENIQEVSFGKDYVLALSTGNELYAWGVNSRGQLGIGNTDETDTVIKIMDNVSHMDAGSAASLAITENGELYTWGDDTHGCLGQGIDFEKKRRTVDMPEKIMDNVKSASIDGATMIILTLDGDVFTCGWNESGQLGTGDTEDRNIPEWVYNINESENPGKLSDENTGVVSEEYFDEMDSTPVTMEGSGENITVNMMIDHLSDFVKYNGGNIELQLSDGNIALMFQYTIEDDMATPDEYVHILTQNNGNINWMGAGWHEISCEQNEDILSWNITLPSGSFATENIKYIGVSIHTSRSRSHVTTYEMKNGELFPIDSSIEQIDVAVNSWEGYHQYIE